jgi:hypothetical protein
MLNGAHRYIVYQIYDKTTIGDMNATNISDKNKR